MNIRDLLLDIKSPQAPVISDSSFNFYLKGVLCLKNTMKKEIAA